MDNFHIYSSNILTPAIFGVLFSLVSFFMRPKTIDALNSSSDLNSIYVLLTIDEINDDLEKKNSKTLCYQQDDITSFSTVTLSDNSNPDTDDAQYSICSGDIGSGSFISVTYIENDKHDYDNLIIDEANMYFEYINHWMYH